MPAENEAQEQARGL